MNALTTDMYCRENEVDAIQGLWNNCRRKKMKWKTEKGMDMKIIGLNVQEVDDYGLHGRVIL